MFFSPNTEREMILKEHDMKGYKKKKGAGFFPVRRNLKGAVVDFGLFLTCSNNLDDQNHWLSSGFIKGIFSHWENRIWKM